MQRLDEPVAGGYRSPFSLCFVVIWNCIRSIIKYTLQWVRNVFNTGGIHGTSLSMNEKSQDQQEICLVRTTDAVSYNCKLSPSRSVPCNTWATASLNGICFRSFHKRSLVTLHSCKLWQFTQWSGRSAILFPAGSWDFYIHYHAHNNSGSVCTSSHYWTVFPI